MKLPTTRAGITALIRKMRNRKDYLFKIPSDSEIRKAEKYPSHRLEREFPAPEALKHALLIEAQGPCLTVNEDDEFSSPGLTDWYVNLYCRTNHLK